MKSSLQLYLDEIDQFCQLSHDEQITVINTMNSFPKDSEKYCYYRNIMIETNMKLVVSVAKNYIGRGVDFEDLIQEGVPGLIKAIENFDVTHETVFSTYAVIWIKQYMELAIQRTGSNMQVPHWIYMFIKKIIRATTEVIQERDCQEEDVTDQELADKLGEQVDMIHGIREVMKIKNIQNLDEMNNDAVNDREAGVASMIDESQPDILDTILREGDSKKIIMVIDQLPKWKYCQIVKMRYGLDGYEPMTLESIAAYFKEKGLPGNTRESVRQLEAKALSMLRSEKYADQLKEIYEGR